MSVCVCVCVCVCVLVSVNVHNYFTSSVDKRHLDRSGAGAGDSDSARGVIGVSGGAGVDGFDAEVPSTAARMRSSAAESSLPRRTSALP